MEKMQELNNKDLEELMEKVMATHSSTLAWKIPWMEEPGRLQSMGLLRVRHDWVTSLSLFTFMHWRRKWQPLQCSCLENPRDGGPWWAAVYGVTQSWTRLKWLSNNWFYHCHDNFAHTTLVLGSQSFVVPLGCYENTPDTGLEDEGQIWSLLSTDGLLEGDHGSNLICCPVAFCLIHVPCDQLPR